MAEWFLANYVNILLILAVAALVFLLIRGLIRDKKAGKSACGGNCAACGGGCAGCAYAARCQASGSSRQAKNGPTVTQTEAREMAKKT